jgi:hypothetical protein
MNTAALEPVSFEIEVEKNANSAAPPVKQRLEEQSQNLQRDQLTLQMIEDKLNRAHERRDQVMASQFEQLRDNADRVGITKERKSSLERAQGQKIIEVLGQRQQTAEFKRTELITERRERARNFNQRILLIRERKNSIEKAQEEKVQETLA